MKKITAGVTLYELLLTLGVAALLATLALPGLGDTLARSRLVAERNALHHALHRARRVSITRNAYVVLCKTAGGERCDPGLEWHAGWMMFVDEDQDFPPQRDAGEIVIQHHQPPASVRIRANRDAFVVRTVRRRTTNGTFVVCDAAGRGRGLALIVSHTGRPRMRPLKDVAGRIGCTSREIPEPAR